MYRHCLKRVFDFLFASVALLILLPVLLLITVGLHVANKGAGAFFFRNAPVDMANCLESLSLRQ